MVWITKRPHPGGQHKLGIKREAVLATLAQSDPPEGYTRWMMQLWVKRLVELKVAENISDETVHKALKKTSSRG